MLQLSMSVNLGLQPEQERPQIMSVGLDFISVLFLPLIVASVIRHWSSVPVRPRTLPLLSKCLQLSDTLERLLLLGFILGLWVAKTEYLKAQLLLSFTRAAVVFMASSQCLFHVFLLQSFLGKAHQASSHKRSLSLLPIQILPRYYILLIAISLSDSRKLMYSPGKLK